MLTFNTTLVLGAGASAAMGYPTGGGLRERIIRLADTEREQFCFEACLLQQDPAFLEKRDPQRLLPFIEAFSLSGMYSIDAFLARREEFTEIGKQAIAAVLLECEQWSARESHARHAPDDAWYQYLWNQFGELTWDELDFSRLRIVTFNYDRSLEHYLLQTIQHSHGKSLTEAVKKLKTLQIVHVYGSLAATLPGSEGYLNYGHGVGNGATLIAARTLKVIPEGRKDSQALDAARQNLLWADRIGFLGFGFDKTNLERLDALNSCQRRLAGEGRFRSRQLFATTRGMTDAEEEAARLRIWPDPEVEPRFFPCNCLSMLRQSALLQ